MTGQTCRLIRFNPRPRRRERPAATLGTEVAHLILARWGKPASSGNLDALESALAVPIAQLAHLSTALPRWICSDESAAPGLRIREA